MGNLSESVVLHWSESFNDLGVLGKDKLLKIAGCCVLGIKILKVPRSDKYRPIYVCYPLWKSDIKKCFEEPIFTREIRRKKGTQFDLSYQVNDVLLPEAIDCTIQQVPILGRLNFSKSQLIESVHDQLSDVLVKASPVSQAKILELELLTALYFEDFELVKNAWINLESVSENWSSDLFAWKYGEIPLWLSNLRDIVKHRDWFVNLVEVNLRNKKITGLPKAAIWDN